MSEEEDYSAVREFPRLTLKLKAEYRTAESFMESYMKQVGQGGLFIEHKDPPQMGSELEVNFNLPGDSKMIHAKGKVVWRMTTHSELFAKGVGLKFTEISDEDRKRIGAFVESHSYDY